MSSEAGRYDGPPGQRRSPRRLLRLLGVALLLGACSTPEPVARPATTTSSTTTSSTTTSSTTTSSTTTSTTTATSRPPGAQGVVYSPAEATAGFVAFGDFGGGPGQEPVARSMARWIEAGHRVDALVTTGDNVYDFGEPSRFEAQLVAPYRDLRASGRPLWATLGNHDVAYGHGAEQLAFLRLPLLPYAQQLPGVRLLFLDANNPDATQAQWLDQQLAQPGPAFSVVVFHQPAYSCGLHGPTPGVVANWVPVLERHRVALVLNGHDHLYNRFLSAAGITYVVTGGGGRGLYPMRTGCAPLELRAQAVRYHFTSVEVLHDRLVVTAVADDGSVLDQVEIPAAISVPSG